MVDVKDVCYAIETKEITPELEQFIIHWLSEDEKTKEDREFMKQLAQRNVFPTKYDNLFRGCDELIDGNAESYSNSIITASRFAGKEGYVVAIDTYNYCYNTFDFGNFIWHCIGDVICGERENCYSNELLDAFEVRSGEGEVIVITDLDISVVMKVSNIGSEL